MTPLRLLSLTCVLLLSATSLASAEILALLNYESKPGQPVRRKPSNPVSRITSSMSV